MLYLGIDQHRKQGCNGDGASFMRGCNGDGASFMRVMPSQSTNTSCVPVATPRVWR